MPITSIKHLGSLQREISTDGKTLNSLHQSSTTLGEHAIKHYLSGHVLTTKLSVWYQESGGGTPDDPKIQLMPELSRIDADVSLFFLEADGVGYIPQVDDPWYSAHIKE
jgi:hypothetical protein